MSEVLGERRKEWLNTLNDGKPQMCFAMQFVEVIAGCAFQQLKIVNRKRCLNYINCLPQMLFRLSAAGSACILNRGTRMNITAPITRDFIKWLQATSFAAEEKD